MKMSPNIVIVYESLNSSNYSFSRKLLPQINNYEKLFVIFSLLTFLLIENGVIIINLID